MPLLATFNQSFQIGVPTATEQATGEYINTYSYAGQPTYACRFFDRALSPNYDSFGQFVNCDAILLCPPTVSINPLALTTTGTGRRSQVQVTNTDSNGVATVTTWEVLKVRDLGNMGRMKEVALKRWLGS